MTTSPNALRDIVLPPSLLTKLLNVAGANINATINSGSGLGAPGGPFSSPIPWRKVGLRYTSNEIYFDMVEEYKAIVNKHGVTVTNSVWGKIETNTRLSGAPDCLLSFTNPQALSDCSFHPCVRLQRWARDKTLSFIPPDGKFILAEYRYMSSSASAARFIAPNASAHAAVLNPAKDSVPVPFSLKIKFDLEELSGSFEIMLTSRLTTRPIENLVAEIPVGEGASGIKCVASRGSGGFGRGLSNMETGMTGIGASWSFDSVKKIIKWEIVNIPPSSTWNLRGSFTTLSTPRPSHGIQVRFEIQSHTFSALKVEQLKVTGEMYKPYKGVRGRSIGNVEWRW